MRTRSHQSFLTHCLWHRSKRSVTLCEHLMWPMQLRKMIVSVGMNWGPLSSSAGPGLFSVSWVAACSASPSQVPLPKGLYDWYTLALHWRFLFKCCCLPKFHLCLRQKKWSAFCLFKVTVRPTTSTKVPLRTLISPLTREVRRSRWATGRLQSTATSPRCKILTRMHMCDRSECKTNQAEV